MTDGIIISQEIELLVRQCPVCFVAYAISKKMSDKKKRDGGNWYCPNGDTIIYTDTEVDRERKRAERAEGNLAIVRSDLAWERNQHAATKDKLTKVRNRIQNGICPDCHRRFINLARHMETKHPVAPKE